MNNITGFQRMRRLAAEKAENKARSVENDETNTNTPNEPKNSTEGQDEGLKTLTVNEVDNLSVDDVKIWLEKLEIKFAHNTGETKLREKLKDAVNG